VKKVNERPWSVVLTRRVPDIRNAFIGGAAAPHGVPEAVRLTHSGVRQSRWRKNSSASPLQMIRVTYGQKCPPRSRSSMAACRSESMLPLCSARTGSRYCRARQASPPTLAVPRQSDDSTGYRTGAMMGVRMRRREHGEVEIRSTQKDKATDGPTPREITPAARRPGRAH
jgi:hypothetical protein